MPISAFIVRVPAAEALVQALRLRFDATACQGVPAHITVLVPFLARQLVTPEVLRAATAAFATVRAFAFTLNAVHRWPQTVVLKPSPAQPFVELTMAIAARFPQCPPYEGQHDNIVPHLTAAHGSAAAADLAEAELRSKLAQAGPVHGYCREVELLENTSGRWQMLHVFALGPAAG